MKLLPRVFDVRGLLLAMFTALTALMMTAPMAHAQASATGSITVNGKKTELKHAYAFTRAAGVKDMVKTTLILADKPLPAAAVTDSMERSTARKLGDIKMLVVGFNDEKDIVSFSHEKGEFSGSRVSSAHKVTFDTFSDQALKGRLFTSGEQPIRTTPGTYSFDVQFNAAMTVPRAPDAMGKKAWDTPQGKVLADYLRAARASDKAALKRLILPEYVKELEGPKAAEGLKFLKMSSPDPKTAEFESLMIEGNVAKAKIVVRHKGATETTGYELRRVGDAWLVVP
ncbi:MAG: hypothetical protein EAZ43_07185 [Betaproteobacteria bacterium]|nr:MAG: hypothetical protein EAZ43_07185 [Betaproteobacteria bacterium]